MKALCATQRRLVHHISLLPSSSHHFHSLSYSTTANSLNKPMEVEVKLRLPSRGEYDHVANLLANQKKEYEQENVFFDGSKKELGSVRSALRLRFFEENENNKKEDKCVVTLKEAATIVDGISRAQETEEAIDPVLGRQIVDKPSLILSSSHALLQKVVSKYKPEDLVCLGGFKNTRKVFDWKNHLLELDETRYEFGTTWEIEIESTQPEEIKKTLQSFLSKNNISYKDSLRSKFANFITKKID